MANTYTLISSNVLSSSAASVTFSSIPATYTDLVLRISTRNDAANTYSSGRVRPNNSTTNGSSTELFAYDGTNAGSARYASIVNIDTVSDTATANTFASTELYFPNYAGSSNKVASSFSVAENNSSTSNVLSTFAFLWRDTTAITSLVIIPASGNWMAGSSFYLYGIKSS